MIDTLLNYITFIFGLIFLYQFFKNVQVRKYKNFMLYISLVLFMIGMLALLDMLLFGGSIAVGKKSFSILNGCIRIGKIDNEMTILDRNDTFYFLQFIMLFSALFFAYWLFLHFSKFKKNN